MHVGRRSRGTLRSRNKEMAKYKRNEKPSVALTRSRLMVRQRWEERCHGRSQSGRRAYGEELIHRFLRERQIHGRKQRRQGIIREASGSLSHGLLGQKGYDKTQCTAYVIMFGLMFMSLLAFPLAHTEMFLHGIRGATRSQIGVLGSRVCSAFRSTPPSNTDFTIPVLHLPEPLLSPALHSFPESLNR